MPSIRGMKFRTNRSLLLGFIIGMSQGCTHSVDAKQPLLHPEQFESLTAENKLNWLWNEGVLATEHKELPPFQDIKIIQLILSSLKKKMEYAQDFAPKGWKKPIHRRGVVAKVRYVPAGAQSYSGVFQSGAIGLIRASLTYTPEERGVAPGIALKLLRDGVPSVDASFLTGLDSHGQNYNFFAKTFSNFVPPSPKLGSRFVSWIFSHASRPTNMISVAHFAGEQKQAPRQIFLKAPEGVHFPEQPARDIRLDLMTLQSGQVLFQVFARPNEQASDYDSVFTEANSKDFEAKAVKIGELVLDSKFVASDFGDDQLFFRHEKYLP